MQALRWHGRMDHHDIPRVLDLMATGRLDASSLVSGIRSLAESPEAFTDMASDPSRDLKVPISPKGG